MKKIITCFIIALFIAGGRSSAHAAVKLNIICTTFPQYDWVRQLLGKRAENMNLTLLLDNGVDLHNYQPAVEEVIMIYNCDLFVYVGGESDAWTADVLKDAANQKMVAVSLAEVLGDAVAEEEEYGEETHDDDKEHSGHKADEHVWLSLRHAKTLCGYIAGKLGELDPENAGEYAANAAAYAEKLDRLDEHYRITVSASKHKTLIFGDRFPFRYLADDYGLSCFAAFSGCSAETEASFKTVAFLAEKADELALSSIIYLDGTKPNIAKTISENTKSKDKKLVAFNSMQSITLDDVKRGASYISIMERNLEALREALN